MRISLIIIGYNTIISQYTYNYGFSQGDNSFAIDNNFSPQSNCKLYINNSLKNSVTRSSNSTESLSASLTGLSDGTHEWYISCTDSAGWSTESSHATFILDTTGPVISLVSPENTIIANGTDITFTVSDSPSNVSSVWYSLNNGATNGSVTAYNNASTTYTINSSEQFTADTNNLIIYANDTKSNPSQKNVTFYVDVDPPSIELVSPVNDTFNSGSFRINATDNYASSITCQILIDGQVNATSSTSSKAFLNFNLNLSEGSHTWKITCTDLIGNLQTSATRIVKIDTTQPSIDPLYPLTVDTFNSLNGAADINYRLTETNPEKCILYVDNTEKSTVTAGTNFTNITFAASSQNSPFNWKVWCNDSAGNNNTSTTNSIYYDIINPVISNIANTSLSEDSVTISWSIDETSNNSLFYGANNALLAQKKVDTLGTSPTTSITGLSASTLYYFRVQSCDQFSHCINSSEYNVTTSAAPSTPSSGGGGGGGSSLNTCGVGYEKVNGKCILKEDKPEKDTECTPHWECSEWSSCSDGQQIRMCQDSSLCGKDDKPDEKQSCTEKAPTEEVVAIDEDLPAESDTAMDKIPLGVSAATGIFRQMKTNWKPITGIVSAIGILTILGSALFQRGPLAYTVKTVKEWKEAKMQKEEEEIREKLRNQGLIK
ncbi:fibronectin type III domain-containing protein [Candidatus Woesearchaeota archaeon]|nr:fibronectin type III domain-containing protein [Candidatus Woesearchaeota archaeon]